MKSLQEKQAQVFDSLKDELNLTNVMQTPKIDKIVVNVGTGSMMKKDRFKNDFIAEQLAKITGQKPAGRQAKSSIAGFKVREGDVTGQAVTLRGAAMHSFFDKLVNIALPRTKDFRGLDTQIIDGMGNMTLGIKDHTIFPETGEEELHNIFGMSITIVTTAPDKESAEAYLRFLGVPFKKKLTAEQQAEIDAQARKEKAAKAARKAELAAEAAQAEAEEAGTIVTAEEAGVAPEEGAEAPTEEAPTESQE